MADQKPKRRLKHKKTDTVRELKSKNIASKPKVRRLKSGVTSAKKPFSAARRIGQKEYYLPLPKNRFGKFLNKRRRIIPKYFRDSYQELKLVKWPDRKKTAQLTFAVFVFVLIFGAIITVVDYGLDKLFKKILLQ